MEAKRVFMVEDDEGSAKLIKYVLEGAGHQVVGEVYWAAAAMNAIASLGELAVDVITLDQDIFGGDIIKRNFIEEVRRTQPQIKIIGLSCSDMTRPVDFDLGKCHMDRLPDTIEKLFAKVRI